MHENLNPHPDAADDPEIDLLDLLVVAAENVKLLTLGPLIVGLLALAAAYAWPKTYESVSVLSSASVNTTPVTGWATSADVLLPVIDKMALFGELPKEQALRQVREMVRVTVGKQDKLITLTTEGSSPDGARQLNKLVLEQFFQFSRPKGPAKEAKQFLLDNDKASLVAAVELEKQLASRLTSDRLVTEAQSRVYSDLLRSKSGLAANIAQVGLELAGLSNSDVLQAPTLPDKPIRPKKAIVATAAALLSAFALLVFVFVRQSLRNAGADPATASKLQRIRRALGLRG